MSAQRAVIECTCETLSISQLRPWTQVTLIVDGVCSRFSNLALPRLKLQLGSRETKTLQCIEVKSQPSIQPRQRSEGKGYELTCHHI